VPGNALVGAGDDRHAPTVKLTDDSVPALESVSRRGGLDVGVPGTVEQPLKGRRFNPPLDKRMRFAFSSRTPSTERPCGSEKNTRTNLPAQIEL
jgi:hypothetical protein